MSQSIAEARVYDRFFPPLEAASVSLWSNGLNELARTVLPDAMDYLSRFRAAVNKWESHPDHGAVHSYNVFQGMMHLAKLDGRFYPARSGFCRAAAVLHDLFQFLPMEDPVSRQHPQRMAQAVRYFGAKFNLSTQTVSELARAIGHHDDSLFSKKPPANLPYESRLLAHADRLYGAGLSESAEELVRTALLRNRTGGFQPQGWHFIRDFTLEERRGWRYGDRWYSDNISAVRGDLQGNFQTAAAQAIAEARKAVFPDVAASVYGADYAASRQVLADWERAVESGQPVAVRLVGKNPDRNAGEPILREAPAVSPSEIVRYAFSCPLPLPVIPGKPAPTGWFIQISTAGAPRLLDPSVARFGSADDFLQAINQALF
ncbi:HD domain-containing protein [Candidatus Roizmanbacteria bacterium]|nr:HD domain-containing protein [Candidatus Roizmanbacteria bacterium]